MSLPGQYCGNSREFATASWCCSVSVRTFRHRITPLLLSLLVCLQFTAAAQAAERPPAEILAAGRAAFEDGLYETAQEQLETYLSKADKNSSGAEAATILLARTYYGERKHRKMLSLLPSSRSRAYSFWRAMAQYELQEYGNALSELDYADKAAGDASLAVQAQRLRSHCYLKMGETAKALGIFERIEDKYPESLEAPGNLLDWAKTLIAAENAGRAKEIIGKLIRRAPDTPEGQEGRNLLGRILIRDRQWHEAEDLLQPLAQAEVSTARNRSAAWYSLAEVYEALSRQDEATNALHHCIERTQNPEDKRRGTVALGRLLLKMGRPEEGIKLMKSAVAADPADPTAGTLQLELAGALLDKGNAEAAAEEYQRYLDMFSDSAGVVAALSGRGWALSAIRQPRYAEAAALFERAYGLGKDPAEKARCLLKVGDSYFQNAQYNLAATTYKRMINEYPDSALVPQALFQTAEGNARAGDVEQAERMFHALIELHSGSAFADQALLRLAELKKDRGEMPAALADYEKFMDTHTNGVLFVNALYGHGMICWSLSRFAKALEDFERVVALAPDGDTLQHAFFMRSRCAQMLGYGEQALSICREFVRRFPESRWAAEAMFWIGEDAFNRGSYQEAESQFLALVVKYPANSTAETALLGAGLSAVKQQEYLRAAEYFGRLAKEYPNSPKLARARYLQGDALTELARFSAAIVVFEEVLNKYPNSDLKDLAQCRKGDCELALGRDDTNRYVAASASFRLVAESDSAPQYLKLQANYKMGLCLRKLRRENEAFDQYYLRVICPCLDDWSKGVTDPSSGMWLVRAGIEAADILESQDKWREAVSLLTRIADTSVPGSKEAADRIERIRAQHQTQIE